MNKVDKIFQELSETNFFEIVDKKHIEARLQYPLAKITVDNDNEFNHKITDYYNYHFDKCVSQGAKLSRTTSMSKAKEIINNVYKCKDMTILHAYSDCKNGRNGGMMHILDLIMENFKSEEIEHHIRDVIDKHVVPSSFMERISIINEIFEKFKISSEYVDVDNPEKYANDYKEIIKVLAILLNNSLVLFRRFNYEKKF